VERLKKRTVRGWAVAPEIAAGWETTFGFFHFVST